MTDLVDPYEKLLDTDYPTLVEKLAEDSADAAIEARVAFANLILPSPVAAYWNPRTKRAGYAFGEEVDDSSHALVSLVMSRTFSETPEKLAAEHVDDYWVKIAYSPTLRTALEVMHYFPSRHFSSYGGKPVAAVVASSLLGTGLGYGTGALLENILPGWARQPGKLRKNLAIGGGLAGLAAGSVPGLVNKTMGRRFNDPTLWNRFPNQLEQVNVPERAQKFAAAYAEKCATTIGTLGASDEPLVEVDELGRVVWGAKLSPELKAMTMGAAYGASRIPDANALTGTITPHQLGMFGVMTGAAGGGLKGYLTGRAVGIGLGALTGMPQPAQDTLARTGLAAGVISNLVPRLFD